LRAAAQIAAAAHAAALKSASGQPVGEAAAEAVAEVRAGHGFPEDDGPWSGDDAHDVETADEQATQGGAHVELESDISDGTGAASEPEATRPEASVQSSGAAPVEAAVEVQPAARGRRRRGRVVAPAGPPRGSGESGTTVAG